jgi:very-short-patch-repair endonuclease
MTWEQAVLAAVLSAGPDVRASVTTAAAVHDLKYSDRYRAGIHLTSERYIRLKGVTSHRGRLTPAERAVCHGIPVTSVERTIIDLAGTLTDYELGRCLDDALVRGLASLERLRTLVDEAAAHGGRRLLRPVQRVLAERAPGYRPDESDFEVEMNRMWDRLGLPPAVRQQEVVVDGHRYRLDRAIVDFKIGVEWDSDRFHSTLSDRAYDSERRTRLIADGWVIIPVTGQSRAELVARAVLRAYRDRGGPVHGLAVYPQQAP